jgi:hypothetical protein
MTNTGTTPQPHNTETEVTMAFLEESCPTHVEQLLDYIQLIHQQPDQSLPALLVYGVNPVQGRTTIFGRWLAQILKTAPTPPKTMDKLEAKYLIGLEKFEEIAKKIPGIAVPDQLSHQLVMLAVPQWLQKSPWVFMPLPTSPGRESDADLLPQLLEEIPALHHFLQNRSLLHANEREYCFATPITLP